jgi:signal peptidase I
MAAGQSKVVRAAYIVAFIAGGLSLLSLVFGPSLSLFTGAIYLVGGLGIKRGRAWSAYGLALFLLALLLVLCISLLRAGQISKDLANTAIGGFVMGLAQMVLFFMAGRSLWRAGPERGEALPWGILATLVFVPFLFVRVYVMPTPSMQNTVLVGDAVVVRPFTTTPRRGDIIVFRYPIDPRQLYIKRLVGIGGDRIKIRDKRLFRNGIPLDEPYAIHIFPGTEAYRDNFPGEPNGPVYPQAKDMLLRNLVDGEIIVPDGRYFTLGDNRDN